MKNFTPGFELKPFGLRFQLPTSESTSRLHQTSLVSKDEGFINRKTHKFMSKQILNISVFKQTFSRVLSNKAMSKESSGALVDCRLAVKIKKKRPDGQTNTKKLDGVHQHSQTRPSTTGECTHKCENWAKKKSTPRRGKRKRGAKETAREPRE